MLSNNNNIGQFIKYIITNKGKMPIYKYMQSQYTISEKQLNGLLSNKENENNDGINNIHVPIYYDNKIINIFIFDTTHLGMGCIKCESDDDKHEFDCDCIDCNITKINKLKQIVLLNCSL